MNKAGTINSASPANAIPGGEITLECEGFTVTADRTHECLINGEPAAIVGVSSRRVVAIVPERQFDPKGEVTLKSGDDTSEPFPVTLGSKLTSDMHIVANPAVDPNNDTIILTRSGSRGQQLPETMFRLEPDGYVHSMNVEVMNPTGVAFDDSGELYVTNRAEGEVYRISDDDEVDSVIGGFGVATGIAFDREGVMYVGDRGGTIYRIPEDGRAETFAVLEPSVAAYHMAFGPDGRLFVTAPGLASYDAVYVIDQDGSVDRYFRGLGRPQGLAFDTEGNLYVAACYGGRHGIVRIPPGGETAEMFVAGNNVIGLCFTRQGEMIVATNDSVYSLPVGIYGTLLQ